jgi:Raf kinase inhibitor-like YbhB/YbcL family protein
MRSLILALAAALALCLAAATPALAAMTLSSADLTPGGVMPAKHIYPRCGGQNVSPQLTWSAPPAGAKSLVLTVIDQDPKPHMWSHWVVTGLPPTAGAFTQGAKALPPGARGVKSNFGDPVYAGPCPPPGSGVHRYQFTVWAMPTATVAIAPDTKADALMKRLLATSIDHASVEGTVAAR